MATYNLGTSTLPSNYTEGDIINCLYTGSIQNITLPIGIYKLECWGAKGGGHGSNSLSGGHGGYSYGILNVTSPTTLYLVVGGKGVNGTTQSTHDGGYNGGGRGTSFSGGGGGATHIALASGTLSSLYSNQTQILMVAGGGAGAASSFNNTYYRAGEGLGGGTNGRNGLSIMIPNETGNYTKNFGLGGTQNRAGYALANSFACVGSFGQGGDAMGGFSSGGGGGYFGGGGALTYATGGGGSGYINENRIINGVSIMELNSTNPDTINYHGYIRITVKQAGIETGIYIKINGEWRMIQNGVI